MKRILLALFLLLISVSIVAAQETASVPAEAETEPSPGDGVVDVSIWVDPSDPAQSLLVTSDEDAGLVTYDLQGVLLQTLEVEDGEASQLDLRYSFPLNGQPTTMIALGIGGESTVLLYSLDPETRMVSPVGTLETGVENAALCMYFSPISDVYYVFNIAEDGAAEQYELTATESGQISGTLRHAFNVGGEVESCAVDDELGSLYIVEGDVALWRYGAEPESGSPRNIVDVVGGDHIETEVEGITVYQAADGEGYVIISDEQADRFVLYDREDNEYAGTFSVSAGENADDVGEAAGMAAVSLALGDAYPTGLFVSTDDANTDPDADGNFKLVLWGAVAQALDLVSDPTYDVRSIEVPAAMTEGGAVAVTASVETEPVPSAVDAADDPAVWINGDDPAQSVIIGTDKTAQGGLVVYNLDGSIHQRLEIGEVNNVDLRYNFLLDGEETTIVTATNRSNNSLIVYRLNEETRELEDIAARDLISNVQEVYGFCMYVSAETGKYYAFINSADTGEVEQWELVDNGSGQVDANVVRTFTVGSQTEGCVADDELGSLYIGEEAFAVWKYGAEPDAGDERVAVDTTDEDGHLTADVEGMTIYYASDGAGYLIVSSQGSSEYVVYDRADDNAYIGKFVVTESDDVDGISGTDGIDVSNAPLGEAFPNGVFIAQDDTNINPEANQNFKLVPWENIARALNLTIDITFDPRDIGEQ
jgi:3-phytase